MSKYCSEFQFSHLVGYASVIDEHVQTTVLFKQEASKTLNARLVVDVQLMELWMETLLFKFRNSVFASSFISRWFKQNA